MSHLSPALYATLAEIVPDLHVHCVDRWCVIGSAAALLLGAEVSVADVDVLTSASDAVSLVEVWGHAHEPEFVPVDAGLFRSRFARFRFPGMAVEVMGGLECHTNGCWEKVLPGRMVLAGVGGLAVPVPSIADQIRIMQIMGREKDLLRIDALRALALPAFDVPVLPSH